MKLAMRWFGAEHDTIPLAHIRQVPGVVGVVTTLYGSLPGQVWERDAIRHMKAQVKVHGLEVCGIESVNVHDAIKAGLPERDMYIDRYIRTLEHLGEEGIDLVCYNFMPVFDFTRTELKHMREDGATVFAYDQALVDTLDPQRMNEYMSRIAQGFVMPGWEPERVTKLQRLFQLYSQVDAQKLFDNLVYFLQALMPVCRRYGIRMAIHPDDPPWSVFGLPRIVGDAQGLSRIVAAVDDPHNGITLCTGSLGANPHNDLPPSSAGYKDASTLPMCAMCATPRPVCLRSAPTCPGMGRWTCTPSYRRSTRAGLMASSGRIMAAISLVSKPCPAMGCMTAPSAAAICQACGRRYKSRHRVRGKTHRMQIAPTHASAGARLLGAWNGHPNSACRYRPRCRHPRTGCGR